MSRPHDECRWCGNIRQEESASGVELGEDEVKVEVEVRDVNNGETSEI